MKASIYPTILSSWAHLSIPFLLSISAEAIYKLQEESEFVCACHLFLAILLKPETHTYDTTYFKQMLKLEGTQDPAIKIIILTAQCL